MDFREHNRELLEDWLMSYRDRFPSGPQEILRVENRKLESKAPIKGANYLRLDDAPYYNSDQILLGILVWLNNYFSDYYAALDPPYLNPDTSISELDKYKRLASSAKSEAKPEKAADARDTLKLIREAKATILDALEMVKWVDDEGKLRRGHKLNIPRQERARLKEVAVPKERRPKIVEEFLDNYNCCGSIPQAIKATANSTDYRKTWIYFVTEDVRKSIKESKSS